MLPFLKSAFLLHHKFKGFLQKLTSVDHAARPVVNSRYQNPLFLNPNNKSNSPQTSSTEKWDQPNRTLTHALVQTMQPSYLQSLQKSDISQIKSNGQLQTIDTEKQVDGPAKR